MRSVRRRRCPESSSDSAAIGSVGMTHAKVSPRPQATRSFTFAAAAGLVLSLTGYWNAPENLVPTPVPEPEDLVGAWINPDDGGRIDFRADGTCRLTDIPEGALSLDPPGPDGTPTGRPIDTEDCVWRVDEDDPGIDLARAAPCSTSGGTTAPKSGSGSVIPTSGTPTSL
jgi:hypothetical protein